MGLEIFDGTHDLMNLEFSEEEIKKLIDDGYAVDGSTGGLLIGAPHGDMTEGKLIGEGILVVCKCMDKFIIVKEYEGFEYLLNGGAAKRCEKFSDVNDLNSFTPFTPGSNIRIIDLTLANHTGRMKSKLLVLSGSESHYSLINRGSTQRHLQELNDENEKWVPGTTPAFV